MTESPKADNAALDNLAYALHQRLDAQTDAIVALIRRSVPEYDVLPIEDVRFGIVEIVREVIAQVASLQVDATRIAPLADLARRRAEQGFPLGALTRSIQLGARYLLSEADTLAPKYHIDAPTMLKVHDFAWQFVTDAASVIAEIQRDIAIDAGHRESGRRADFLRGVLHGTLAPARLATEARVFGIDPTARYFPLRARPSGQQAEDRISSAIRRTSTTARHKPVLAVLEGDLVGLLPQPPTLPENTLAALGEAVRLSQAADSFRSASLALDAAAAFGREGVVTLADLGPLPLALMADDLAATVEQQYFRDLDSDYEANRDIEQTVWTFFECDLNADAAAEKLHVHRNTVRYRLGRFREITGLDVRANTHDFVLAWWALARRARQRQ
ncbi:helix-turn-helix domain-containing protein [Hoyosella rhizosphaerae]|uniref:Transcriptional regulator n=1 Tax=Hoyosella rhizosphaerae TaxID=1755582 RepID=A0A916U142_9ACTN|nr:helix-turn-helix domain-containing protein [Hoyosella rhizosphaerae]MBN4926965.1 helix-turn-helix domain-containing protein [Hoyosella rhizosphaerae]GGC55113.1 transcriptional regulator [Hoyosella rhizosphaerae]